MKTKIFAGAVVAATLIAFGAPMYSFAQTATVSSQVQALLDQIKNLQTQLQTLQSLKSQVANTKADIRETIQLARQLRVGMSGEDVTSLQEILAADPTVYPEGKITGFFGPLTEKAVKNFQKKHNLDQVGEVGPKTKNALYSFLGSISSSTAKLPPGLAKKLNASLLSSTTALSATGGNITICHIPPGNPSAKQTITIGAPAWNAHSKHGDTIGACGTPVTPTPSDTVAPVISGVSTQNLLATSTSIVWTTNESANSKVWFGTTTPLILASSTSLTSAGFVTSHVIYLSNIATSTTYYYVAVSSDSAGNIATSSQNSFVTPAN